MPLEHMVCHLVDPGVPHEHVLAGHLDVVEQQVAVVERVQAQLRPDLAHSDAWGRPVRVRVT